MSNLHFQPMEWWEYEKWVKHLVKIGRVTREKLDKMVKTQKGLCAICKEERRLVLDHNHKTKKARGLLCYRCNGVVGIIEKYRHLFIRAAAYIRWRG